MSTGVINRIARLPTATGHVDVTIRNSTIEDLVWWDKNMQPIIDSEGPAKQRADVGWDWIVSVGAYLDGTAKLGRQRFLALTMGVQGATTFIPVGLLCVVLHAGYLPDPKRHSIYVLYLADAYRPALAHHLAADKIPRPIAKALLDIALCESIIHEWEGRLGLYAAEEGGSNLTDFYANRHMDNLPKSKRVPKRLAELGEAPNVGRFFYYDCETPKPLNASKELDGWR